MKGDPYEEIYKLPNKWFGLLRPEWINPADAEGSGFKETCLLLDRAKKFHNMISTTYHSESYAHYGADRKRAAWHNVVWEVSDVKSIKDVDRLSIASDDAKGRLHLTDSTLQANRKCSATLLDAADPGDQTVPLHSADAQLLSGKFQGIFRQTGYEHQASYRDAAALASTLYSLIRIASKMKWTK